MYSFNPKTDDARCYIMHLIIKKQWLSHSWIYVTLQQNKHCYKFHVCLAYVKYKYNHILSFHSLKKKEKKDDLIASFVYNPAQILIPCDSGSNTLNVPSCVYHNYYLMK